EAPDLGDLPNTYVDATVVEVTTDRCLDPEIAAPNDCRMVTAELTSGEDAGDIVEFAVPATAFDVPELVAGDEVVLLDVPTSPAAAARRGVRRRGRGVRPVAGRAGAAGAGGERRRAGRLPRAGAAARRAGRAGGAGGDGRRRLPRPLPGARAQPGDDGGPRRDAAQPGADQRAGLRRRGRHPAQRARRRPGPDPAGDRRGAGPAGA